ncbi:hypothetical protein [Oceanobacillus picturae]|uniref:hypothetical protein n=1 Tax=Oceanobacillus picturae TaxID=171693 RepID=UPI000E69616D|nr:hypothetical protein [Oceanobacillus picturae]RIU94754.1 hypothetical protein D1864_03030 [Oceanobacillus picturae]
MLQQRQSEYFLTLWTVLIFILYIFISPSIPLLRFYEILDINNLFFYSFIVLITLYLITLIRQINIMKKNGLNMTAILTMVLFLAILLIQFSYYLSLDLNTDMVKNYFSRLFTNTLFASSLMFFLGLNINVLRNINSIDKIKKIIFFGFWLYILLILYGVITNPFKSVFGLRIHYEPEFNYLNIADSFAIYSLLTITLIKKRGLQFLCFLIALIASFVLASRTSLVFLALSVTVYFLIIWLKKTKIKTNYLKMAKNFSLVMIIFISLIVVFVNYFNVELITQSRLWNLISRGGEDSSLQVRFSLLNEGFGFLKQNWLLGSFGGEVYYLGPGTYIHNWLSFLGAYGIIPFILSIIIMVLTTLKITKMFLKYSDDHIIGFLFVFNLFILLSIWFSRAYTYEFIWFILIAIPLYRRESKELKY